MATIVTVTNQAGTSVSIRPNKTAVSSIAVTPSSNITLGTLTNVDLSNVANNEVLTYNAVSNTYTMSPLTIDANTLIYNINGGTF
jgi:hypothetical protein